MSALATEPIPVQWTPPDAPTVATHSVATAVAVAHRLARGEVSDLDPSITPLLAAAAAELAAGAGIGWHGRGDDPPVVLVRLIARVAVVAPTTGGTHTGRLLARLG